MGRVGPGFHKPDKIFLSPARVKTRLENSVHGSVRAMTGFGPARPDILAGLARARPIIITGLKMLVRPGAFADRLISPPVKISLIIKIMVPHVLDVTVVQAIIAQGGIFSRYFVQRLHMNFGAYDNKLIELKIAHGIGLSLFQKSQNIPWASDLPISVYIFLLKTASEIYKSDLCLKGNDMELFHLYTGGPQTIHYAPLVLAKNFDQIKDLILRFKFIPLPPKSLDNLSENNRQENIVPEEYPPNDGHEKLRQLITIARPILICKDVVNWWKGIGYSEICNDVNDLVMQVALLIMFHPQPSSRWSIPDIKTINARLSELIEVGFQLTYCVILDILLVFEKRSEQIGKILLESFADVKHE
ncbi:hypothetical protein C2G38_2326388 [Gigaspora rosea]|uniref:Uncharacterized protein n=1 Tax=Gigaspora rosea TaxID=44941 RepID=A0A397UV32_9GLOM|nr:hypothetical protein C2G38_2326388 [Gigaspora rosea]